MVDSPNFEPYLRSLTRHYAQWREFYTSTEAIRLTVQVVQSEAEGQPSKLEKIERWSVLEGIRNYAATHVLLSGRPGSGKSTALRRLLLEEAEQSLQEFQTIPVLVELRSGKPILKLIESTFRQHRLRISVEQIDELLFEGKLLLLLDGVNEIPTDELLAQVEEFRGDNLATPMIFTTRDLGMGGDLRIEKRLMMEPLNSAQMRQFVGKYLPSEQGESLLQQLGDRLKELSETPLLLKMLCDVFELRQEIPNSKGELFRWVDREYDRLKGMTTLAPELRHWQTELLQRLAFEMIRGNNPTKLDLTILRTDAIAIFEAFLQEHGVSDSGQKARVWLEDLQKYHLLQRSANQKIEFHHQLFQEYYAAEYLLQRLSSLGDVALQREYLNYLKWTEPLALMLGLVEDEEQALRVVELAIGVDLMLGARLAGEVKQEFQSKTIGWIRELTVPELLKVGLLGSTKSVEAMPDFLAAIQHPDFSVRWSAANALGQINGQDSVQALLRASKDSDPFVRLAAVAALGTLGNSAAIEALLEILEDAVDGHSHLRPAYELGKLGNNKGIQRLKEDLNHQELPVVRRAISGLRELNTEASNLVLLGALCHSKIHVRALAVQALGKIGNDTWILNLLKVLEHEDSRSHIMIRLDESVVDALGQMSSDRAIAALISISEYQDLIIRRKVLELLGILRCDATVPTLQKALKDEDTIIRKIAANSLAQIDDRLAASELLQLLEGEDDDYVREHIAKILGQVGDKDAVPKLLQMLTEQNYDTCQNASQALGRIGGEQAISRLLELLKDPNVHTRQIALKTLGLIGNKAVIQEISNALEDEEQLVVLDAAVALVRLNCCIGTLILIQRLESLTLGGVLWGYFSFDLLKDLEIESAIPVLLEALKHQSREISEAAAYALDHVLRTTEKLSETMLPFLRKALENADNFVYTNVISILYKINSKEAVAEIIKIVNHHVDQAVRVKAASALAHLGNETAMPALVEALQSEDLLLRSDAAYALEDLGSEAVVSAFIHLLSRENSKAKSETVKALEGIGNPRALTVLKQFELKGQNYEIAMAIASIQARCQFYNYEIYQSPPEIEAMPRPSVQPTPSIQYDIKAEVVQIVEHNDGKIIGKRDHKAV